MKTRVIDQLHFSKSLRLAVDIDDSLADTAWQCFTVVTKEYGLPDGFTLSSLVRTYQQPGLVKAWQKSVIQNRIRELLTDRDWLLAVSPIKGAQTALTNLPQPWSVGAYLTSRLGPLETVTEQWLSLHGFPEAPVITRQAHVTKADWKLDYLATQSEFEGLIDNELGFLTTLGHSFAGRLIWFNQYQLPTTHTHLTSFSDWHQIAQILLQSN